MDLSSIPVSPAPKSKQVNARLTPGQETALRQHCVRNGLSTQAAIIAALTALIDGFDQR